MLRAVIAELAQSPVLTEIPNIIVKWHACFPSCVNGDIPEREKIIKKVQVGLKKHRKYGRISLQPLFSQTQEITMKFSPETIVSTASLLTLMLNTTQQTLKFMWNDIHSDNRKKNHLRAKPQFFSIPLNGRSAESVFNEVWKSGYKHQNGNTYMANNFVKTA